MKFGQHLQDSLFPEWRFYYINYDGLKAQLKADGKDGFSDVSEAAFVRMLEAELEKVTSYRTIKADELTKRVERCETSMQAILATHDPANTQYDALDGEITRIVMELTELSKYIRLNYSGFLKILKKHDKHTRFMLKPTFMVRMSNSSLYKESFDSLIIRLSKLFDISRTRGETRNQELANAGATQANFVRRTTKYWVHPDNVTEVKCIILKYLPVLVFNSKTNSNKPPDPAISSIYFDNDSFDLYLGRLEKSEGAEAIRLRWYGGMDNTEIFVERKTHREDWTGETSVKERFPIKEKYVNDYLKGTYSYNAAIEKARAKGTKTEEELENLASLATAVQNSVATKHLVPMVRTFYNRTAFQLPGDARVRISLDTELTMIREDNFDKKRSGDNWRRTDAGTVAPFDYLPQEDVHSFPYAVLEVKLQTQMGTEAPRWVEELVKSHLVEEVPKFSKFIHGVAILLESRVTLLPFWLPQMDKDIRKTVPDNWRSLEWSINKDGSNRNAATNNQAGSASDVNEYDDSLEIVVDDQSQYTESAPLLGGESSDGNRTKRDLPHDLLTTIGGYFGKLAGVKSKSPLSSSPKSQASIIHPKAKRAQKRIILPVRVEPKVFFANERTFLSWLHFCIVLGGLALGLLNFGDRIGQISGMIFTLIAMLFMLYALFLYQWRAHRIRNRDSRPYDDRVGPTVLVLVLFSAMLVNFWLKFTYD